MRLFTIFLFFAALCLIRFSAQCQSSSDSLRILSIDKNLIEVAYDLKATEPGLRFRVIPYYIDSMGNKMLIQAVKGDIGEGVDAGMNKTFVWEFARELMQYHGPIKIAIEKDTLPPPVSLLLPKDKFRRSAKLHLKTDSLSGSPLYEIIDANRQIRSRGRLVKRQDEWQLTIPVLLSRNEKYRTRIWNSQGTPFYTSEFMVRRKIPLSTQIAGAALIVGGVLYFILKPPPTSELPTPFGLPDNDE